MLPKEREKAYLSNYSDIPALCKLDLSYENTKYERRRWGAIHNNLNKPNGYLIEYAFKSGVLLPEELLDEIRKVLIMGAFKPDEKAPRITRVVVDDVALIDISYPFLKHSRTSSDLFLPALVHIVRNCGADLMLIGTPGESPETRESVERTCALSNAALSTRFTDVFGDRYITVTGMGLVSSSSRTSGQQRELVPGVVRVKDNDSKRKPENQDSNSLPYPVYVDGEYLAGLVGFDAEQIHRPGLTVHLFNEGKIQEKYNDEIREVVQFAYARPPASTNSPSPQQDSLDRDIRVEDFNSEKSGALHESLHVLGGKPLSRTVVHTVDEFWEKTVEHSHIRDIFMAQPSPEEPNWISPFDPDHELLARPYTANILLLAYDPEKLGFSGNQPWNPVSWKEISDVVNKNKGIVCYDKSAEETLNCALLDALLGNMKEKSDTQPTWKKEEKKGENALSTLLGLSNPDITLLEKEIIEVESLISVLKADTCTDEKLNPNAALYVCWYSQLRQMIDDEDKKPGSKEDKRASKLRIASLPGGGFRGDWFLAIAGGSVSISLGQQVIDRLCTRKEEYKRFMKGVGMPVTDNFYENTECGFTAWPGSSVQAIELLNIHRNARSRAHIPHYLDFQAILTRACEKLLEEDEGAVISTLRSLGHRIAFVTPKQNRKGK